MTTQTEKQRRIIRVLADGPLSGRALADFAELSAGQFYPAIMKMEAAGIVASEWEDGPYPRRRIYRLPTTLGGDE
jgi:DNA-binding PadR family transcriptional regulator